MAASLSDTRYAASAQAAEIDLRLKPLSLTAADISVPPLIIRTGQRFEFAASNPVARPFLRDIPRARDLDHMKELFGVPNAVFEHNGTTAETLYAVDEAALLAEGPHMLAAAGTHEGHSRKMALNLLLRWADPALLKRSPYKELVDFMLAATDGLKAVVGDDLVVENGATVDLGDHPIVSFNRIIIHGTGQLVVHDHQKVSANTIQWLPD
jgi:hypothetical protein